MKILAILQARVSSSRLPRKILNNLLGQPMLVRQVERIKRAKYLDHLLVATSSESSDDLLIQKLKSYDIPAFRGSMNDVLDRFYQSAKLLNPQHVVRLTGDCPLIDPQVIDLVVQQHLERDMDYTSNILTPTYPDGLDVEVVKFSVLEEAWREAQLPSEREHVTPFIKNRSDRFSLYNVSNDKDLSSLRWTVDEPNDFLLIERIYKLLYPAKPEFTMLDILALLNELPELKSINRHIERNAGFKKSLDLDREFLEKNE